EISQRALVNFLHSMKNEPGLRPDDRLVAVTTLSFDIAGLELFLPLTVGAQVVIAGREVVADGQRLLKLMEECKATAMQATPATWRMLIEAGWQGEPRMKALCGGEGLPRELANQLLERSAEVWNLYGPTETTIWSAAHRLTSTEGPVVIGRPIANTQIYIVNQQLQPVPVGVAGELMIGGGGVARGFLHRTEMRSQKVILHTLFPPREKRMLPTV